MERLKVILIDDEMLIRKLVRMKMDAENLGLEIVGEYSNGVSALEAARELNPDIVISDICMPEQDGITFSEKCTELFPDIKIIIVTGYDDFDYARRSIKAGVFDYLMKPVQAEELNRTLQKAVDEIRRGREEFQKKQKFLQEMEKNLPALRDIYINRLLVEEQVEENLEEKLAGYGISGSLTENSGLRVGILVSRESIERPELSRQIKKEVDQFFLNDAFIQVVIDSWGRTVIISNGSDMPFVECLDLLLQMLEKKRNCSMMSGLSETCSGWKEVHKAYLSAIEDMQKKHEIMQQDEWAEKTESDMGWKEVSSLINLGQVKDAVECCQGVISRTEEELTMKKASLLIQKLCIDAELNQRDLEGDHFQQFCCCRKDIESWVNHMVRELAVRKTIAMDSEKGNLIGKILVYMKEHVSDPNLSINSLANEFCVSSSHLSRMFRQFTGMTCGEYLSVVRLWKMIELLNDSRLRDRDIGERIGIVDAHYLSIWFRKMTGYSVTEYRKLKAEK